MLGCLAACKPAEESHIKALVGAVLIDGTGGPPVSNSVILIAGPKIAEAGSRTNIAIPQGAEEIDGSGKFVVPAPIDLRQQLAAARSVRLIDGLAPAAEESVLEQARRDSVRVFARVSRRRDAERLVSLGAAGFVGMITDTEELAPDFLARLRDLRIVWAPALSAIPDPSLAIAERNTKRLFAAGVPIAVAGSSIRREMELLVEAGLSPGDTIVAATRNAALALGTSSDSGTLQSGKRADLLLLPRNPIEDIGNLSRGGREMRAGAWVK